MSIQKLLGIDTEEVTACLTSMVTVTRGEHVKRTYSVNQSEGRIALILLNVLCVDELATLIENAIY